MPACLPTYLHACLNACLPAYFICTHARIPVCLHGPGCLHACLPCFIKSLVSQYWTDNSKSAVELNFDVFPISNYWILILNSDIKISAAHPSFFSRQYNKDKNIFFCLQGLQFIATNPVSSFRFYSTV
jgi:hypothetical protein